MLRRCGCRLRKNGASRGVGQRRCGLQRCTAPSSPVQMTQVTPSRASRSIAEQDAHGRLFRKATTPRLASPTSRRTTTMRSPLRLTVPDLKHLSRRAASACAPGELKATSSTLPFIMATAMWMLFFAPVRSVVHAADQRQDRRRQLACLVALIVGVRLAGGPLGDHCMSLYGCALDRISGPAPSFFFEKKNGGRLSRRGTVRRSALGRPRTPGCPAPSRGRPVAAGGHRPARTPRPGRRSPGRGWPAGPPSSRR